MIHHNKVWAAIIVAGWIALFIAARVAEQHGWMPAHIPHRTF